MEANFELINYAEQENIFFDRITKVLCEYERQKIMQAQRFEEFIIGKYRLLRNMPWI